MTWDVVVNGAAGRMGRLVAARLLEAGVGRVAGYDPAARAAPSSDADVLPWSRDLLADLEPGGVVVDFSHPAATPDLVRAAAERDARLVVGTTGQSEAELAALEDASRRVPVVVSRNFSLGVNVLLQALPELRVLIESGFDVECVEAHHRQKRDAPSGTALLLLEALLGADAAAPRTHGRHGREARRQAGEVGVHSLRLGQVTGDHALLLAHDHEVVEIRHRALDRGAFTSGVVPAVRFVRQARAGLYSMLDVMRHARSSQA